MDAIQGEHIGPYRLPQPLDRESWWTRTLQPAGSLELEPAVLDGPM